MENVASQAPAQEHAEEEQHPIGVYLKVWILLFVLSFFFPTWWIFSISRACCAGP